MPQGIHKPSLIHIYVNSFSTEGLNYRVDQCLKREWKKIGYYQINGSLTLKSYRGNSKDIMFHIWYKWGKISWKKGKACLFKNLLRDAYSNPLMGLIKNDTFISSHPPFWIKDTNLIFQEHFSVKFFLVKQEKKRSILAVSYFGIMTRKDTLKLISASFPWNPLSLHRFIMKETRFIKSYHNGIILQNKDFLE